MRLALYVRVSTRDEDQNLETQLLRREAERADDAIVREYADEELGDRASRRQLLRAAQAGQVQELAKQGLSRRKIAEAVGTTVQPYFRAAYTVAARCC